MKTDVIEVKHNNKLTELINTFKTMEKISKKY